MTNFKDLPDVDAGLYPEISAAIASALSAGALLGFHCDLVEIGYGDFASMSELTFPEAFAMDAFGDIFVRHADGIARIDTETGDVGGTWGSPYDWLADVASNPDRTLGLRLLKEWENLNGPLAEGHRLTPKIPFVFGGSYDPMNIVSAPVSDILEFRSDIAHQIRDLPDGARVLLDTD